MATEEEIIKIAAASLGRRGGLKGGPARAKALSQERRLEIAQKAAQARWGNEKSVIKENVKPIEMSKPIQQKPHVPNPPERKIVRVPQLEERQGKIERPKALYTNLPSPYGLATEMLMDQLKNG